jgi:hypothetical protein
MSVSSFITINKLSIVGLKMRLPQIQNQYLYEGLDRESRNTVMLWESAGIKLREAQLTADQIQQLFAEVEKGATAGGSNRTMLGKGKDAASAVNKAWEDLKSKVQDSKPIKNIDAAFDQAVAKIEAGLGGPDNAVNQVIQKYRKFAKERPIAQSLIYAALIAAAGISGAGLGGAAVLGLLKMTDKLLQGEKFSSAAYAGGKTGALAYGASKLGDLIKGKPEGGAGGGVPDDIQQGLAADQAFQDRILNKFPPDKGYTFSSSGDSLQVFDETGRKVFTGDIPLKTMDMKTFADLTNNGQMATPGISSGSVSSDVAAGVSDKVASTGSDLSNRILDQSLENPAGRFAARQAVADALKSGDIDSSQAKELIKQIGSAATNPEAAEQAITQTLQNAGRAAEAAAESITRSGKHLSEGQVYLVFNRVCATNDRLLAEGVLKEGPMDFFKGAAAKGMQKLQGVGKNLTTKVTADKLNSAWQKAGAPTDSEALKTFLQSQGVDQTVVDTVYSSLKIKSQPVKSAAGATDKTKTAVSPTTDVPAGAEQSAATQTLYAQLKKDVMGLNKKEKQRIFAYLQKQLGTV